MKNTGEFQKPVELGEIQAEDAARLQRQLESKQRTRQRHGNKGSRVWGYSTGGGTRGKRR